MPEGADKPTDAAPQEQADKPAPNVAILSEPSSDAKKPKKEKKQRPEPTTFGGKLWYNWVKPIGTVIIIVVVLRSMLIDWNDVPTGSMEPEIHVGDRIAVNRLAYALQFPLTGPTIGIPFTPIQFDNPLDGIPQIQWSSPDRGDIVTFWNPVTDVRMVKRIIAVPGDTVSMNGGVLTINGETAEYEELDAVAEGLPLVTKYFEMNQLGRKETVRKDLEYQSESLLGLTRTVQQIKERWVKDAQIIALPGTLADQYVIVDEGWVVEGFVRRQKFDEFIGQAPPGFEYKVVAEVKNGAISIDGEEASYNELAKKLLAQFAEGDLKQTLAQIGLGVDGHELIVDGEPVAFEVFRLALNDRYLQLLKDERSRVDPLRSTLGVLHQMLMTSFGPLTLGDGDYYMVGDNRNNSHDSRYFGAVKQGEITGEAFAVAFSFKDNQMFALPPKPNWSRWFKDLD